MNDEKNTIKEKKLITLKVFQSGKNCSVEGKMSEGYETLHSVHTRPTIKSISY